MTLVSVAISVFNVEKYINECLLSICNQTYSNLDIIIIDDASTDGTLTIIKEFAVTDERIKIIPKNRNEGLGVSRNEALNEARGDFIIFLDGDDIYDLTLIQKAVQSAHSNKSDIVYWDYAVFMDKYELDVNRRAKSDLLRSELNDKIFWLNRPAFTWVKMIRISVLQRLDIKFPAGYTRQDIPVHWQLVTRVNNISIIPERLAFYRQHPNATTSKRGRNLMDLIFVTDLVETYLVQEGILHVYRNQFYRQRLNFFHSTYDGVQLENRAEVIALIKDRLSADYVKFIGETKIIRPQAKLFLKSIQGSRMAKLQYNIWRSARALFRIIEGKK